MRLSVLQVGVRVLLILWSSPWRKCACERESCVCLCCCTDLMFLYFKASGKKLSISLVQFRMYPILCQ